VEFAVGRKAVIPKVITKKVSTYITREDLKKEMHKNILLEIHIPSLFCAA